MLLITQSLNLLSPSGSRSSTGGYRGWPYTHICAVCRRYLLPGQDCPHCTGHAITFRDERDLILLGVL